MTDKLTLVNSVRNYLASFHMYAEDEWLIGCVDFLSEDNNINVSDIAETAKEQWLLNNLRDICPGSLPENLKDQRKTVLNGKYVLQVNAAEDIGTPAYQQYLKLQKVNMENVEATTNYEEKIPSHRMIKLFLTDGVQDLIGLEYKPMRNLSCDITPGCKILIKGPIECRRGVALLTESEVELMGGEVEDLGLCNSLANRLARRLGMPPVPKMILNTTSQTRITNLPAPHTSPSHHPTLEPTSQPVNDTSFHPQSFDEDIDIDQLAAIEAELTDKPSKRTLNDPQSKPEKKLKTDSTAAMNNVDDYPDDNDLYFNEDEDYLREIEARIDASESELNILTNNSVIAMQAEPFVYLKQITNMKEIDRAGKVFKVKAQIMKLLSKLSVGKDGWSLSCTIVDGTASLDVEFTSDVLSALVGLTPHEMNVMKKQMATQPELKKKAVAAFQKAKDTLQVLYCIVELTMSDVPKITALTPFNETHLQLLKQRQNAI